jgi:hypothetical protein
LTNRANPDRQNPPTEALQAVVACGDILSPSRVWRLILWSLCTICGGSAEYSGSVITVLTVKSTSVQSADRFMERAKLAQKLAQLAPNVPQNDEQAAPTVQ